MPTVNQYVLDNVGIFVVFGLLLVVAMLALIASLLMKDHGTHVFPTISIEVDEQISRLNQAAEHHADVSAVVSMVAQLDAMDEDAVALLGSYPESVRAAAWLHLINCLGSDLQAAQQRLSDAHQGVGSFSLQAGFYGDITKARLNCQQQVDDIRAKLDNAIRLSGRTSGLHSV